MNDFLPSPESLTRPAPSVTDAPPIAQSADGLPLSLSTAQGLEAFLEQRLEAIRSEQARNINQAIMTVIPDVLDLHHAQQTNNAALVHVPRQQHGQGDTSVVICAGVALLTALIAVGGMGWTIDQSPQESTQKMNAELLNQLQLQNQQLIQSNEQIQQSQQRCPRVAIAATCNIGE